MQAAWEGAPDATTRWRQLRELFAGAIEQAAAAKLPPETRTALEVFIPAVVIFYTYPRLCVTIFKDSWVKAPFSVNLTSGRIRVPIDPATVDDFNPDKVPLVKLLTGRGGAATGTGTAALAPYLDYFQRFVDGCTGAVHRTDDAAGTAHPDAPELASAARVDE